MIPLNYSEWTEYIEYLIKNGLFHLSKISGFDIQLTTESIGMKHISFQRENLWYKIFSIKGLSYDSNDQFIKFEIYSTWLDRIMIRNGNTQTFGCIEIKRWDTICFEFWNSEIVFLNTGNEMWMVSTAAWYFVLLS